MTRAEFLWLAWAAIGCCAGLLHALAGQELWRVLFSFAFALVCLGGFVRARRR